MDKVVFELLENKKTDEKLYTLADISSVRAWNYELPTLTFSGRFSKRQSWNTSKEFRDVFCTLFPLFDQVDLNGLAVMGGAIFDILHDRNPYVKDIDVFMAGDAFDVTKYSTEIVEKNIIQRAEQFIQDIYKYLEFKANQLNAENEKAHRPKDPQMLTSFINQLQATRNGPVITFSVPTMTVPIQLVLAPHANLSKLFQRVDLDCTAMAYYQQEIYFSSLAKFSYENACVIIGLYTNPSYEERLQKYYDKGMDIILPYLDVEHIPKRNLQFRVSEVIDLQTIAIVYSQINGNKILIDRLIPRKNVDPQAQAITKGTLVGSSGGSSNSYSYQSGSGQIKNSGQIIHENIVHLIHDLPNKLQFSGEGKYISDVLLSIPKLTNRMITNSYETIQSKLLACHTGNFDIKMLEDFITCKPLPQIISDVLLIPLQEKLEKTYENNEQEAMKYTLFDKKYAKMVEKYIETLIQEQIQVTTNKLTLILEDAQKNPLKYPVVSLENALINESLDAKQWYAPYYKAEV